MMDLAPYFGFLKSLSELSHFQFEVWDGRRPVFATAPGGPPAGERETLVSSIAAGRGYRVRPGKKGLLAGAPLQNKGGATGALIAWSNGGPRRTPADSALLEPFLLRLTEVLERGWATHSEIHKMTAELTQCYEDIFLYGRLSSLIKTLHFSVGVLQDLIGDICDALHADLVFVTLARDGQTVVYRDPLFHRVADPSRFAQRLVSAIPADAPTLQEHYVIVNDSGSVPAFRELHPDPFRSLLVTIQDGKNFYGWIGIASFNMNQIFRRSELRLTLSIAEQVGVLITNTDLYRELERFNVDMVKSLVQAIEAKDPCTRGHSERVGRYCLLLAEKMGLEQAQRANLQWAAMLHDVGKIGVTEMILNKPGPLTADEYEQIKNHPIQGHAILKPLAPLAGALPGILHHHERYDGKGYPHGLKGEEIPLLARIIAVPDTFDAINSRRAYREGIAVREAVKILKSVAGSQLDARIVGVFAGIIAGEEGRGEERP